MALTGGKRGAAYKKLYEAAADVDEFGGCVLRFAEGWYKASARSVPATKALADALLAQRQYDDAARYYRQAIALGAARTNSNTHCILTVSALCL